MNMLAHYLGLKKYEDTRRNITHYELKDIKKIIPSGEVMLMPGNDPFVIMIESEAPAGIMSPEQVKKLVDKRIRWVEDLVADYAAKNDVDLVVEFADVLPERSGQSPYIISFWVYERPFKATSRERGAHGRMQVVYNWKTWKEAIDYINRNYLKWSNNGQRGRIPSVNYQCAQRLILTDDVFKEDYLNNGDYPFNIKDNGFYHNLDFYVNELRDMDVDMALDINDAEELALSTQVQDPEYIAKINGLCVEINNAATNLVKDMEEAMVNPDSWKAIRLKNLLLYLRR